MSADLEKKQRFEREARLISSLSDPHFATILEIGRAGETDFVVTEYIEGSSLATRLKDGALPLDEALNVAISIADAFNTAHRNGVTHRDLKPSSVMLSPAGVKLVDFGLADPKTEKVGGLVRLRIHRSHRRASSTKLPNNWMAPSATPGRISLRSASFFMRW